MKTSTKRILSIGASTLFFIGILLVYANLIKPEVSKATEKRAVVVSKEALFNTERSTVAQVQEIISRFQSLTRLEEIVTLALPLEEDVTGLLNQIQSIANLSGVGFTSFSLRPLPYEISEELLVRRLGVLELNVGIRGAYENIKQFLRSLETNVRVINVRSFRLTSFSPTLSNDFNLALTVETYYQED